MNSAHVIFAVLEVQATLVELYPFEPWPLWSLMMASDNYTDTCMHAITWFLLRDIGLRLHLYVRVIISCYHYS